MDPSTALSPAELYELIGILSGVGVTGVVGFLLVRRAKSCGVNRCGFRVGFALLMTLMGFTLLNDLSKLI